MSAALSLGVLVFILSGAAACRRLEREMRTPGESEERAGLAAGSPGAPTPLPVPAELGADERATIAVFEAASPSVVFITNTARRRNMWSLDVTEVPQGTGSGFVWDTRGHIVTNFHVVYGADAIEVVAEDRKSYRARVVGVDPDHDLALLRIDAPAASLVPVVPGDARQLRVGQKVLAIGNPFGLDHTLTTGVVSAVGRTIKSLTGRSIEGVIQTDAAINPGNSGGPLLDSAGRLIGVNTQIVSPSGAFAGVGFAVPVEIVARAVPQLLEHGRVIRPWLGVSLLPDTVGERWGIEGAVIYRVVSGSPAADAGLRGTRERFGQVLLGDVIVTAAGEAVKSADDLYRILDRHGVGDRIAIEVLRDGRRERATVELAASRG